MKPQLERELQAILKKHNWKSARGNGPASFETQAKRAEVLYGGFNILYNVLKFKIESIFNYREYHMKQLAYYWEKNGIKDIQTRISIFRVFANLWLGKHGMIRESERYVRDPASVRRRCATTEDKTWTGKGVDVISTIKRVAEIDPRVAVVLELMYAFGLRIKEALLLHPHMADKKLVLAITRGAKGGRNRVTEIQTDVQQDVLERAKTFAHKKTSSMIPDGKGFNFYRKRVYRVCNKVGIQKKLGVVPHGLRHEWANAKFEEITQAKSPIKGGKPGEVSAEQDKYARHDIAESLGHSRPNISSAYLGAACREATTDIQTRLPSREGDTDTKTDE